MGLFQREPVAAQGRLGQDTLAMNTPLDDATRRKRLIWRATHRGIKEMDLILGGFVTHNLAALGEDELADLERIMEIPDQEMLAWATRQAPVPPHHASPLLARILAFRP
jgi:antitoxin CptB